MRCWNSVCASGVSSLTRATKAASASAGLLSLMSGVICASIALLTASRGTGWVWDASQGYIVTNAHVVAGGKSYSVAKGDHLRIDVKGNDIIATPNGKTAKLVGDADCADIGVLKVSDTSGLVTSPRGSQKELRIGDHVVAVGYPATLNTTTSDVFSTPGFTSGDLTATSGDVSQTQTTFGAIPGEGRSTQQETKADHRSTSSISI